MRKIRLVSCSVVLALALLAGCKSGAATDMQNAAQGEACTQSCGEAETKCNEKCASEVDKDACQVACKAAKDKCVEECKKQ